MDVNKAVEAADEIIFIHSGQHLSDLERAVLIGCLQSLRYDQISVNTYHTYKYIKDIGSQLWRKLSDALGEKVRKTNIQFVLERHCLRQSQIPQNSPGVISIEQSSQRSIDLFKAFSRHYVESYSHIKILPRLMQRPLTLEAIYVAVKVLDKSSLDFLSSVKIEDAYRQFNRRRFFSHELTRQDGVLVAEQNQYLMVLGGPGVGKSTFLKKLGLEALKKNSICIPVLVELKKSSRKKDIDLIEYIKGALYQKETSRVNNIVSSFLQQGKFLILLDGLDEVSDNKIDELVNHIREFVSKFNKNRFVISCRTAAHNFNFDRFVDVIIAEFDDIQIKKFIAHWFDTISTRKADVSQKIWKLLNVSKNSAVKDLARSPLLLTYLCLICERDRLLPNTRKELYSKALDITLEDWDKQKGIGPDSRLEDYGLGSYLEKVLLSGIAYENFQAERLFFSKEYLLAKIAHFLDENPRIDKNLTADLVFKSIEIRQGILIECFFGSFCFSHLTFQEYLTAYFVVKNQLIEKILYDHLADSRWREVFLLISELTEGNIKSLLDLIQKQANECIAEYPKLKSILQWCNLFLENTLEIHPTLSRRASLIASISVVASSRASDVDLDVAAGDEVGNALARACESAMALAEQDVFVYKAAVTCAVAIACSRALAYDNLKNDSDLSETISFSIDAKARAASIDSVVHGAGEMIDDASDDQGIISQYIRNQVVIKSMNFACKTLEEQNNQRSFLSTAFRSISQKLDLLSGAIPQQNSSPHQWYRWASELELIWLDSFGIDRDFVSLSVEEAKAWQTYLYMTELYVRCKESVVGIPSIELKKLEEKLLVTDD